MKKRTEKKTAKQIKTLDGWNSDAVLFELSVPLEGYKYVVVSTVNAIGPETYIFGSKDPDGKDVDMSELLGSFRGSKSHTMVLENAGYEIVD